MLTGIEEREPPRRGGATIIVDETIHALLEVIAGRSGRTVAEVVGALTRDHLARGATLPPPVRSSTPRSYAVTTALPAKRKIVVKR